MSKNKNKTNGFTIVELLIVIVVIGILAALVLNTFAGVQARARDNQRKTDIQSISKHLEVYYIENSYYPGVGQLRSLADQGHADWVQDNLPGLDTEALRSPGAENTDLDTIEGVLTDDPDLYGYRPLHENGVVCGTSTPANPCVSYILSYMQEAGDETRVEINSLND